MVLRMLFFGVFATTMMALLLGYIGIRTSPYLPARIRTPFYGVLGLYWVGTIAVFASMRFETASTWLASLNWSVYLFMGLLSIVIAGILLQDLGNLLVQGLHWIRARFAEGQSNGSDLDVERRRMLGGILTAGVWAVAGGISALGSREAKRLADVVEIDVPIDDLDPALNGFRIVQLSDIHIGPTIKGDYLLNLRLSQLIGCAVIIFFFVDF